MLRALLVPLTLLAPESPPVYAPEAERAAAVLRSIDGLSLVPAAAVPETGATVAQLRAGLDRAREAFRTLALDDAIREATDVVDRSPAVDATGDVGARILREAFVRIAQTHQAAGRMADARAALSRAAGVGLTDPLPLTDFPPAVVDGYETEKRRLLAQPLLRLVVETRPPGAEVLVDGLPVTSTFAVTEVLATAHVVTARYAGRGSASVRTESQSGPVRIELPAQAEMPDSLRLEVVSGGDDRIVVRLTAKSGAESIVLERTVARTEVEVAARRLGEALRDRISPRPPPPVAATAGPATAVPSDRERPRTAPFYDRWWFWTAAGVLVVSGLAIASQVTGDPSADVYVTAGN